MGANVRKNKQIATAILFVIAAASGTAHAAPATVIQKLNGTAVAGGPIDLGNNRMLTIVGYAADVATMDSGSISSVVIRNIDNGDVYSAPVLRRVANFDALLSKVGTAPATASKLVNAGFIAVIDSYTLPAGTYEVAGVNFTPTGGTAAVSVTASTKGLFSVPQTRVVGDVLVTGPDGAPVAVSLKPGTGTETKGTMFLAGYPALRNGAYTVRATARNKYGKSAGTESITVRYNRPVVKADITSPVVEGFPGMPSMLTIASPLDNSPLTGTITGKILLENGVIGTVNLQGVDLSTTEEKDVALTPKQQGRYQVSGKASASRGIARIWINAPDAPDLQVSVGSWDPDAGIKVQKNRELYAPLLDPVQILASAESDSNCNTIYGVTEGATMSGSYFQPSCAVRYKTLPDGVVQEAAMRGSLKGFLKKDGEQGIDFETGVLWTHPDTGETAFYKAKDRSIKLAGIEPNEPDVSFVHTDKLALPAKGSQGKLLTFPGQNTAGRVTVTGKYPDMSVKVTVGAGNPKTVTTSSTSLREFVNTTVPGIWETQDVVIESWYNKYPEKKFTKTLTFTAIPRDPVVVLTNSSTVSTNDAIVKGNIGIYQGGAGGFRYDPAETGAWSVQLYEDDGRGNRTALGDPVTEIGADGSFSINLGKQPPGRKNLLAVGKLSGASEGMATTDVTSTKVSLIVADGSALAGKIEVRQPSGPVPFTPSLNIIVDGQMRVADIGKVEWLSSTDGVSFTKIDGQNTGLRPQLTQSGKVWYKAKLTNRHSNIEHELDAVTVQAFAVPKVTIAGDTATFVGQPVVLTASTNGPEADYIWQVGQSATDKNPQIVTGTDTITITPTAAADMLIKVVAAEKGAPADNAAKNTSTTTVLRVIRPGVQRPMISGPGYVETGKEYEFKASVPALFAPGLKSSLAIKGQWVLPDGSTVDGDTLRYTVQPTDRALRYQAWVENVEGTTTFSDFGLRSWTYEWPEWQMVTRVIDNRVPATLRFQIAPKNPRDSQKLGGEKPVYTWQFPSSFKVVSQTAESALVEANEPGDFQAVAVVSDSRGNMSEINSDIVQIAPAPDLIPEVAIQSGDRWNRAPNKVYARINLISVPKNDTFESASFKLNGQEVASGKAVATFIDIPAAGTHEVSAVVRSAGGKVAVATKSIDLGTGDNPTCTIQQFGDGRTSLSLIARCTVTQGLVSSYKWLVNGQPMPATSYMLSFAKKDLDAGVISAQVTATTDKGQEGVATWPK
jgi:hypothetical protein